MEPSMEPVHWELEPAGLLLLLSRPISDYPERAFLQKKNQNQNITTNLSSSNIDPAISTRSQQERERGEGMCM